MDLGLTNRVAFIAGASSGLGYAVAEVLLNEGCKIAICSRDKGRIEEAAAHLADSTGKEMDEILPLVCDVTDEDSIKSGLNATVERFDGLNILITNSGGPPAGYVDDFSSDDWRNAFELNLMSTINLCRHSLLHLKMAAAEAGGLARILMITSVSARQPIPNLYLSNTARAGVQGFAKSLSEELGPLGVTVNTIMPGYTKTERLGELSAAVHARTGQTIEDIEAGWAESNALKRLGEPEEFAATAAFLVSRPAAYITGIGMVVDGGRVKHIV